MASCTHHRNGVTLAQHSRTLIACVRIDAVRLLLPLLKPAHVCPHVLAADCVELLRATTDSLSEWSALIERTDKRQQLAKLREISRALHESSIWLSAAAGTLLLCLQHASICHAVDKRQVLSASGQLIYKVLVIFSKLKCVRPWPPWLEHAHTYMRTHCECLTRQARPLDHHSSTNRLEDTDA